MNITTPHPRRLRPALVPLFVGAATLVLGLTACGSDESTSPGTQAAAAAVDDTTAATAAAPAATTAAETGDVFVGEIPGVDHALVGMHISEPDANGKRSARVYVCDGKAIDDGGFALWFKGDIAENGETTLTAKGSTDTIAFTVGDTVTGSVTFANGSSHDFDVPISQKGSGIYDVTVGEDGSYDGRSSAGDVLDGTLKPGQPQSLSGVVTLRGGQSVTLSESLAMSTIVPGTFTAVAWYHEGRNHLYMSGRSGDVRGGSPGLNIIGLCMLQ